jgi:NADH-quinone oxidoreductase subunit F
MLKQVFDFHLSLEAMPAGRQERGLGGEFYNVAALGPALLTAPFDGMTAFKEAFQKVLSNNTPEQVIANVKASGLRGRGGAGFPMGMKWEFCRNAKSHGIYSQGDKNFAQGKNPCAPDPTRSHGIYSHGDSVKFIICNADEGDPGAYSDRYLLEQRPHSVLFGMMIGAYAIGAEWGVLYIRAEYPESVEVIEKTIAELEQHHLLGDNILGTGFNFRFKIIKAQGAYICGEETALINSIEGQRPEVRTRPPYPAQYGLFGKPTVVNNVETLAALYWIMQNGGEAYAKIGTEKSPGTKLVCLDSRFREPGCYEVEMGTPLRDIIEKCGHGFKVSVKALHIGGPLGGLVPIHKVDDLTLDFESFANAGFLLGHASVVSIPGDFPIIKYLEHLFEFAAHESCGKCFPCRLGTKRAEEMLFKAQHEGYKIDRVLFDDLLHTLTIGSLCAHGGGIPLPVKNALQYFEDELKGYFVG